MHNTFGQSTGNAVLVDKMIGTAYETVRFVAENIEYIKHVSFYMPKLYIIDENITNLNELLNNIDQLLLIEQQMPQLLELHSDLAELLTIYANRVALLELNSNTTELFEARDTILDFAAQFGTVADAIAATAADVVTTNENVQLIDTKIVEFTEVTDALDAKIAEVEEGIEAVEAAKTEVDEQLQSFRSTWLGEQATDPVSDLNGDPLSGGEAYVNLGTGKMRIYSSVNGWSDTGAVSTNIVPFRIVGNGTAGPYTLPETPLSKAHLILYIGGIPQDGIDYTLAGNQLTAGGAVAATSRLSGVIINPLASGQPGHETVGVAQIRTSEVEALKALFGVNDTDPDAASNMDAWMALQFARIGAAMPLTFYGWVDPFTDSLGVDTTLSLNELLDGGYRPTNGTPVITWATTYNPTLVNNGGSYEFYNTRQIIPAALITVSGDRFRVTVTPPTTGSATISNMWIGHAGVTPGNFFGDHQRVTFYDAGGDGGIVLTAAGGQKVSDVITFALDETRDLLISIGYGAGSTPRVNLAAGGGINSYHKAAASNDAGVGTVTGYSLNAGVIDSVDLLEAGTSTPGPITNLTLISKALELPANATKGWMLLAIDFAGALVPGTDFDIGMKAAEASPYILGSPELWYEQGSIKYYIVPEINLAPHNGVNVRSRFRTLTNKNIKSIGWVNKVETV